MRHCVVNVVLFFLFFPPLTLWYTTKSFVAFVVSFTTSERVTTYDNLTLSILSAIWYLRDLGEQVLKKLKVLKILSELP